MVTLAVDFAAVPSIFSTRVFLAKAVIETLSATGLPKSCYTDTSFASSLLMKLLLASA